ncbi:MAG: DUF4381 domain-containing protein [Halioglobus sp.]
MNPQDPLAGLHPLREPELIGWWPLAPGWWLLLALILTAMAIVAFIYYRRYQADAYRRLAAGKLQALHTAWLDSKDSKSFIAATNALLKSVALRAFPQREVAAKNGDQWVEFLNQGLAGSADLKRFPEDFAAAAYRADAGAMNCDLVGQCAMAWIKYHRVPK